MVPGFYAPDAKLAHAAAAHLQDRFQHADAMKSLRVVYLGDDGIERGAIFLDDANPYRQVLMCQRNPGVEAALVAWRLYCLHSNLFQAPERRVERFLPHHAVLIMLDTASIGQIDIERGLLQTGERK